MELILTGYIESWYNDVMYRFRKDIIDNRDKPIDMVICSGGGSVIEGLELSALIKTHEQKTKSICVGFVASIATVIALSADIVVMDENATMLIHNASGGNYGTAEDLRQTADQLDGFSDQGVSYYISRIAKNGKLVNGKVSDTEEMLKKVMKEERVLSAKECFDMGLVDKIINAQIPAQVSDNSQELAQQIATGYPNAAAKYNFTNCFKNMQKEETKEQTPAPLQQQDKKGLFKAFTNAFAALFGFSNDAQQQAEETEETQQPEVLESNIDNQTQPKEMTEEQMIQHLKEKGFDVSKTEEVKETQPEVQETEAIAKFKAEMQAKFDEAAKEKAEMQKQLEEMKAAAFANNQKAAGLHESPADVKNSNKSSLRQKVAAAMGNNLLPEFKKFSR